MHTVLDFIHWMAFYWLYFCCKEHTLLVDWSEKSLIQIVTVHGHWYKLCNVSSVSYCKFMIQMNVLYMYTKKENTTKGAFNLGTCIQTTILLVLCLTLLSCFFQTSPSRSNSPSFVVERCWPKCLISANACSLLCCESCRHSCCGNFTSERSWHFCQVIKGSKKQKNIFRINSSRHIM